VDELASAPIALSLRELLGSVFSAEVPGESFVTGGAVFVEPNNFHGPVVALEFVGDGVEGGGGGGVPHR
jgi:hypothetical protein